MSLSLPRPLPLLCVSALANMLCSALLRSQHWVRYARFVVAILAERGCGQGSLVVGQVQVAMENGNCDCGDEATLCRCRCQLWSRRRLASLAAQLWTVVWM